MKPQFPVIYSKRKKLQGIFWKCEQIVQKPFDFCSNQHENLLCDRNQQLFTKLLLTNICKKSYNNLDPE